MLKNHSPWANFINPCFSLKNFNKVSFFRDKVKIRLKKMESSLGFTFFFKNA